MRFYENPQRMASLKSEVAKLGMSDSVPLNAGDPNNPETDFKGWLANGRRVINELQERAAVLMDKEKHDEAHKVVESIETMGSLLNAWERGIESQAIVAQGRAELQANGGVPPAFRGDAKYNPQDLSFKDYKPTTGDAVATIGPKEKFARSNGPRPKHGVGDLLAGLLGVNKDPGVRASLSEGVDSAGGYSVPETLSQEIIDLMRSKQVVMAAGARSIDLPGGDFGMLRITAPPTANWHIENDLIAASEPTFDLVQMKPKTLTTLIRCSRELLQDSQNINEAVSLAIASAMAPEVDRAILFGDGQNGSPLGLTNHQGLANVDVGGPIKDYTKLQEALLKLKQNDVWDPPSAWVMNPVAWNQMASLVDSTGQPLRAPEPVYQVPQEVSTVIPQGTIITGDWSKLIVGYRSQLQIELLTQTFADRFQFGFLAHLRMDVAVMHPSAFCTLTGITEPSTAPAKAK